jgi:propanol-preferring alcohol dehydrogenase
VVLDFVGADVTGDLAVACGGVGSAVVIVGAGMGGAKIGLTSAPYNMSVSTSLWGRRKELLELVAMAQRGQVNIRTTTYALEDGERAYEDMHAGTIVGRAVVVP